METTNTNTSIDTEEFAKELFFLLLDTHKFLKQKKKTQQITKTNTDNEK